MRAGRIRPVSQTARRYQNNGTSTLDTGRKQRMQHFQMRTDSLQRIRDNANIRMAVMMTMTMTMVRERERAGRGKTGDDGDDYNVDDNNDADLSIHT